MKKVFCFGVLIIAVMSSAPAGSDGYSLTYPVIGVNDGFVFNPYQTGDSDGNQPVVIAAAVAYILGEVKYFTIFFILSAILALSACAILVYIIMNGIFKPAGKPAEGQKEASGGKGEANMKIKENDNDVTNPDGLIPDGNTPDGINPRVSETEVWDRAVPEPEEERDDYIDKQTASMVLLYITINEMLSVINSTIERNEAGRRIALG